MRLRLALATLLATLPAALPLAVPARAGPDALWRIVHGQCVPNQREHCSPAPCAAVDVAAGYAVLKDLVGREQFLLIPTTRIAGIESPVLLRPGGPNYFEQAWAQAGLVAARLHLRRLPRGMLSLAVNSRTSRSQDQLHIHIDCVSPEVRTVLRAEAGRIGAEWATLPVSLAGHRYRARFLPGQGLEGDRLGDQDPFRLLAASLADPARQMGAHTLVLVGVERPRPGFVLLDDTAGLMRLDRAEGESLQDHGCALARAS